MSVMAGLVPAIYVLLLKRCQDVDGRNNPVMTNSTVALFHWLTLGMMKVRLR